MHLFDDDTKPWLELEGAEDPALLADSLGAISLEEAGLEERCAHQPSHGFQQVQEYVEWWSDGEDARDWLTQ